MNLDNVLTKDVVLDNLNFEGGQGSIGSFVGYMVKNSLLLPYWWSETRERYLRKASLEVDIISSIIPFDLDQAAEVARLNKLVKHKGLSLGDRACLALGIKLQAPIYTADKVWSELDIDKADIKLIR